MKQNRLNKIKGFTLVELLVVVAIIAILSVIGLTIFTSAQSNARDARRKADIDAIANAIEVNRAPGTVYYTNLPATTGFSGGVVPVDNADGASKPHYCIRTSVSATAITVPITTVTDWDAATACPGATGTGNESPWTDIASYGLGSGGTAVAGTNGTGTVKGANAAASKFGTNVVQFVVCTRLENSTTTTLSVYCKPGSQ